MLCADALFGQKTGCILISALHGFLPVIHGILKVFLYSVSVFKHHADIVSFKCSRRIQEFMGLFKRSVVIMFNTSMPS